MQRATQLDNRAAAPRSRALRLLRSRGTIEARSRECRRDAARCRSEVLARLGARARLRHVAAPTAAPPTSCKDNRALSPLARRRLSEERSARLSASAIYPLRTENNAEPSAAALPARKSSTRRRRKLRRYRDRPRPLAARCCSPCRVL